jgi:hypothetical protein
LYLVKERLLSHINLATLIRFASSLSASAAEMRTIRNTAPPVNTPPQSFLQKFDKRLIYKDRHRKEFLSPPPAAVVGLPKFLVSGMKSGRFPSLLSSCTAA